MGRTSSSRARWRLASSDISSSRSESRTYCRRSGLRALREEAESLADALASRKAIERAKGLLMEKEGLSEQDAFSRLRRASQVSGRPLKVVAEAVVATLGVETDS